MTLLLGLVRGMSFTSFVRWLRQHRLRRWEWTLLAVVGLVLLLLVLLPGFLRREITVRLAAMTTAEVHIADVDFNPFRGRLALHEIALTLKGEDKPVIALGELEGNLRMLALLRGRVSLEAVLLTGLQIAAIQQKDGRLNLIRLFPPAPPSETPPPESDLPTLAIERLDLSAAHIDYQDHTHTPPAHFSLALRDLAVGGINLQAKGFVAPVAIQVNGTLDESPLRSEAKVFWQRTQTTIEAEVETQKIALTALTTYLGDTLALQRLSGHIGAHLHYRYANGDGQPPVHTLAGTVKLEQLSFADPRSEQTALDLQSGQVTIEKIDLLEHEIRLATVELQTPKLFFLQSASGLNWSGLLRTSGQTAQNGALQPTAAPAWRFFLQEARLAGGEIVYREDTWPEGETLAVVPEEVQIQHLGSQPTESPLRFRARFGEGTLAGEGSLRLDPLSLHTQTQLTGIELANLRPMLARALAAENVGGTVGGTVKTDLAMHDGAPVITLSGAVETAALTLAGVPQPENTVAWESGRVELSEGSTVIPLNLGLNAELSRLSVQHLPQGDVSIEKTSGNLRIVQEGGTSSDVSLPGTPSAAQPPLSIKTQGTLDVSSLLLSYGPEKQELLSCYQVRVKLNEGSRLLPLDLQLGEVTLEYPYAQGFRTANGQFQLFTLSAEASPSPAPSANLPPDAASPAQTAATPAPSSPAVHIDRVTLIGGQLYFEDQAVSPSQMVYWQDVEIDLSDVGYPLVRPAAFTLHAFNNDGAPVEVQGTTQRQADLLLTRVRGKIERLSLSRFNAYLESFLGYRVRSGAVSLTWDLTIPGNRLQAATTVTFHNLGLSGKQSASVLEEQVGLPLQLVIALLKDLNGNINLKLPVEGQFGDPSFRLGGTILQAIRGVLIGAVTSPLKLLGAVFSGEDKIEDFTLEPIPFVPGTHQPTTAGNEQLTRLGRFLAQRPELDLQLSGHTGESDLLVLKDRVVLAQLQDSTLPEKAQDAASTEQKGEAQPVSAPEEVSQYLAYQLSHLGGSGAPALSAQATALLTQMRDQMTIAPQVRDGLSQTRVQAVISILTANPGVTQGRLSPSPEKLRGRDGPEVRYMIQARAEKKGG